MPWPPMSRATTKAMRSPSRNCSCGSTAQEIKESNEDNNATMMSRTKIPPVDAALAKAEEELKP